MPDEPTGQPPRGGDEAPSDDTQRLGPDLTKRVPAEPSPYDATPSWSDPGAPPPSPPYGQQQPYPQGQPQQPFAQGYPQQAYPQTAYGQPYGAPGYSGYGSAAPTSSSKAVAVLVLGIASLLLLFMCGLGLVTSIIALVMAPGAKREIRESQGRLTGLGMVQAGVITSWVTIGLVALFIVVWTVLMTAGSEMGYGTF